MTHLPTKLDAASDLRRCIYASLSEKKFEDKNFKLFFSHAQSILVKQKANAEVLERLKKVKNKNIDGNKRREDLLMASILLQNN